METSAVEEAREVLAELQESTHHGQAAAVALALKPKSRKALERLLTFHEGYAAGVTADQERIALTASALLSQIAKLRDARARSPSGKTMADEFIEGTAPRLFELAERLRQLLEK